MYETAYSYFINPATKKFLQTNEAHSPITAPPSFYFGDRPKFTLSFPADTIAEGDTLIAVLDNENRFLDTKQATGLNPVMAGVLHEVNSDEANAQSLEIQLFDYSKKFADVINGHDNAVTCLFTVYLKSTDGEGNFTFVELGQTIANGEPTVTSPECVWHDLPVTKYYTREELDAVYNQFLAGVSLVVEYSNLAKSYAVGGTGTREGEDTDNAKYYAEMASQAANAVSTMYASIQTLATQIANTKEYIDGLVESIAIDIRDISEIAASVTATAAQVARDAQSVRVAKSSIDASVQFVTQAKSTVENLATQVSQNAVNVSNDKDAVAQLAVQVSNAASQVSRDKADAKGYAESAATSLANVQSIQTDVTQKQTAVTTMKNTIQGWYNQISSWYDSIQTFMEQMQGWWTDVDTWQQQVSEDKDVVVSAKDTAVQAKNNAVSAKTAAETAQEKAEDAQDAAEDAKTAAESARDEAVSTLANKRDILQTLVTSSSTSLEVEAGKSYNWTVSAASTISMKAADKVANKETRIDIYIDLQSGGSVSGDGVAVADAVLQSGWCKLIWDGTTATLYSTKAGGAASVITIPAATTSYTLQDNKNYQQTPSAVPTYTLPSATMDGLVHEITVLVDFMHVTSCSFVDASNVPVTLQSAISPQIGEAYVFRCYWYGKWRVVPLKIRNAATATSSTGVVSVSDAVAGDALAMKMTAPRSVVVNQLIGADKKSFTLAGGNVSYITREIYTQINKEHVYLIKVTYSNVVTSRIVRIYTQVNGTPTAYGTLKSGVSDVNNNDTGTLVWRWTKPSNFNSPNNVLLIGYSDLSGQTLTSAIHIDFSDVSLVDLTQYFNGDSALIDSITSWDDLVAYDPRFASYVEYNTGTVEGVQPQVKVTGKNLLDMEHASIVTTLGSVSNIERTASSIKATFGTSTSIIWLDLGAYDSFVRKTLVASMLYKVDNVVVQNTSIAFGRMTASGDNRTLVSRDETITVQPISMPDARLCLRLLPTLWTSSSNVITFENIQLELGSTATAYEPYHDGGTAQAPAPLFAVGNAADEYEAVAGVTTHKMASVDLGTLDWTQLILSNNRHAYYTSYTALDYTPNVNAYANTNTLCIGWTQQPQITTSWLVGSYVFTALPGILPQQSLAFICSDTAYVDAAAFKAAMSGKIFYYDLATPTTSASTPTQISLQAGNNVAMQKDGGRTLAELAMTYENLPSEE